MSQIDMDEGFSTNHEALDRIPLDFIPSYHLAKVIWPFFSRVIWLNSFRPIDHRIKPSPFLLKHWQKKLNKDQN